MSSQKQANSGFSGGRQFRGRPRRDDYARMREYNESRSGYAPNDWAMPVEYERRYDDAYQARGNDMRAPSRIEHNKQRAQNWKAAPKKSAPKPQPAPQVRDPESFRAKREVQPSRDLYDSGPIAGFSAITKFFGHNLDFSTFPALVERTYREILTVDERFSRKLPFSMFLHYHTVLLNSILIDVRANENKETKFQREGDVRLYLDTIVPGAIGEYFSLITETSTQSGDVIRCNIPDTAIPLIGKNCGSFGEVNSTTHNLYECYVSPLVTRRRFEATINGEKGYDPLPGLHEDGLVPTPNLLGYGPIDDLNPEGRMAMRGIVFPSDESETLEGRLQYSAELMARCAKTLGTIAHRHTMVPALPSKKVVPGNVGYIEVTSEVSSTLPLASCSGVLMSSNMAGPSLGNMMYINGLRRRRSAEAPGVCYLAEGDIPAGWLATRNLNFTCAPGYDLVGFRDDPGIRSPRFMAITASGNRMHDIDQYIERNFRLERQVPPAASIIQNTIIRNISRQVKNKSHLQRLYQSYRRKLYKILSNKTRLTSRRCRSLSVIMA